MMCSQYFLWVLVKFSLEVKSTLLFVESSETSDVDNDNIDVAKAHQLM